MKLPARDRLTRECFRRFRLPADGTRAEDSFKRHWIAHFHWRSET